MERICSSVKIIKFSKCSHLSATKYPILIKYSFNYHHYHIVRLRALMIITNFIIWVHLQNKWMPSVWSLILCSHCKWTKFQKFLRPHIIRLWIWLFYIRLYLKKHLRFLCVFDWIYFYYLHNLRKYIVFCTLYVVRIVEISKQFQLTKERGKS